MSPREAVIILYGFLTPWSAVSTFTDRGYHRRASSTTISPERAYFRKGGYSSALHNIRVLADSDNPSFVRALKLEIGENEGYERIKEYSRHNKIPLCSLMIVVSFSFGEDGHNMLVNLAALLSDGMISINPQFADLIMQLRIAKVKETTGNLDKDQDTLDLVDAMRLSCFNVDYRGH